MPHRPGRWTGPLLLVTLLVALVTVRPASAEGTDEPTAPPATELRVDHDQPPLDAAPADRSGGARVAARATDVEPFTMIGIGAPDVADGHLEGTAAEPEVRVHVAGGGWGAWMAVEFAPDHAPDSQSPEAAAAMPASDPIWVRNADGYEVRLPAEVRRSGITVHLVRDTGRPISRAAEPPAPPTDPAVAARMASARAGQPPIHSRASWGARPPSRFLYRADNLTLSVVHHSVSANSYSSAEVPGIIRGIQAFHMDANGWYDIAYNFVVDRFGVTWEGRGGGIGNAVIGGHAKGFNTGSTGVVTLGEFTAVVPTSAMINSVSSLLGWKLFIHGVDPDTTTIFTSHGNETYPEGTRLLMRRVVGHRDTAQTACPGNQVEARLPTIRASAAAVYDGLRGPGAFTSLPASLNGGNQLLTGDFDGDGNDDAFVYGPGSAPDVIGYGTNGGALSTRGVDITGTYQPLIGDFDGDYIDDVFWYGPGESYDKLWFGTTARTFLRVDVTVNGTYEPVVGDWNDDDVFDVIWYAPGDDVDHLWYGDGDHTFSTYPIDIARTYEPVLGDFDGNGYDDVLWYGTGGHPDRMWWGKPGHSLASAPITVRGSYEPFVGDFTGDQLDDIVWYTPGPGADSMWSGNVDKTFTVRGPISISGDYQPLVGDFNGGGYDDVLLYGPGGAPDVLWISRGNGTFRSNSASVTQVYEAAVIELAHDGRSDILWYGVGAKVDRLWLATG